MHVFPGVDSVQTVQVIPCVHPCAAIQGHRHLWSRRQDAFDVGSFCTRRTLVVCWQRGCETASATTSCRHTEEGLPNADQSACNDTEEGLAQTRYEVPPSSSRVSKAMQNDELQLGFISFTTSSAPAVFRESATGVTVALCWWLAAMTTGSGQVRELMSRLGAAGGPCRWQCR